MLPWSYHSCLNRNSPQLIRTIRYKIISKIAITISDFSLLLPWSYHSYLNHDSPNNQSFKALNHIQYCDNNIGLFSFAPMKLSLLSKPWFTSINQSFKVKSYPILQQQYLNFLYCYLKLSLFKAIRLRTFKPLHNIHLEFSNFPHKFKWIL